MGKSSIEISNAGWLSNDMFLTLFAIGMIVFMVLGIYKISSWIKGEGVGDTADKKSPRGQTVFRCRRNSLRPFSFDGRIGRMQFFMTLFVIYVLWMLLLIIECNWVTEAYMACYSRMLLVVVYFSLYVCIAQGVKRCHDIERTGQFLVVPFHVLVLLVKKGQQQDNEYGLMSSGRGARVPDGYVLTFSLFVTVALQYVYIVCC